MVGAREAKSVMSIASSKVASTGTVGVSDVRVIAAIAFAAGVDVISLPAKRTFT